jgi:hypothetical protein
MPTDRLSGLNGESAIKVPCRACSTSNITLSAEQTIDGIAIVDADRVLVTGQTTTSENGIYTASTGVWSRSADWNGVKDVVTGTLTYVHSGTSNSGYWYVATTGTITVGTTSTTISRASNVLAIISAFAQTVVDDTSAAAMVETLRTDLSALTSPAIDDEILLRDTSTTSGKRMTLENMLKVIDALTAETAPDIADELALFDASASTTDKITLANLLKVINGLTEDTAPDKAADFLLSYDTSATAAKKVKPETLIRYEAVRQTTVTGSVDSNGQANFLSAGTGLAVSRAATTTPVILTVAAGEDEIGPVNYRKRFSADQADYWSGIAANNTTYLFDDRDTSTGAWTAYKTIVPTQYGAFFDTTKQELLPFSGADASTTITSTYSNAWTAAGNAQIDTAVTIDGQNTLLLDGTGDYVGNTTITTLGDGGMTLETKGRINTLPGVGTAMTLISFTNATGYGTILELMNTGGTYNLRLYLSSDGASHNIANGLLGTSSTYATGTDYHFAVVFDPVAGAYYTYRNGTVDETVASALKICALTVARLGSTYSGGNYLNGALAGFRFSPCCRYPAGTTFTAPTLPFTADAEWFDLSTFTYKSGSPTSWTTKQRVRAGEVTTNATVPTSVKTYALRGEYTSPEFTIAASTIYSQNHYLGVRPKKCTLELINKTSEAGYVPGDTVLINYSQQSATAALGYSASATGLVGTVAVASSISIPHKTTGVPTSITAALWKMVANYSR